MRAYAADGHFKAGSMGPKVEACLRFVDAGGEIVIASLTEVGPAMAGKAGTHIVPDAPAKTKRGAGAKTAAKTAGQGARQGRRHEEGGGPQGSRQADAPRLATTGGADVIDITTARRRAVAE